MTQHPQHPISIPLNHGCFAIVDADDYPELSKHRWTIKKNRNVTYAHRFPSIYMHREIVSVPKGMQIDHIDGDGLNNQKSNLRVVTIRQNAQNTHVLKSSKYPGVSWHKRDKKWHSRIKVNGKLKFLGEFDSEEIAALRYKLELMEILA